MSKNSAIMDLPAVSGDEPLPPGREFYGAISASVRLNGLTFGLVSHAAERAVPVHVHETSYYSLVVGGQYSESVRRGRVYFRPFTSALTRAGTEHDGRIASCGVQVFTIEIGNVWVRMLRELHHEPDTVHDLRGGELTWLGFRLYREYCADSADPLTIDALIWELLAAGAGMGELRSRPLPSWWTRVVDLLHADFGRTLRISEIAAVAGVHPIHLARVFRRACRRTPGEYLQRVRVRYAAEHLARQSDEIAQVAVAAGFVDQSHLTRVFKRYAGTTPGEFRKILTVATRKSTGELPGIR